MKPMLARKFGPKFSQFPCYIQPKLNGVRALYQQPDSSSLGVFQSRDEKLWKGEVLSHLLCELAQLNLGQTILDGELYVHGWRLQRINSAIAVKRLEPSDDTPSVEYHVFDVVDPSRSFFDRFTPIMETLLSANLPHIKPVRYGLVGDRIELEQHFQFWTKEGYEGVMLRPYGPYEFGEHEGRFGPTEFRSKSLWKHKQWEDGEFRCVGVTQGEGKADIGIGALVLAHTKDVYYSGPQFVVNPAARFNVGTGFDDSERIAFSQNPPIGKLIKVRYLNLSADGIPQNPSFLAVL